jgi:hypothetical protein
MCGTFVDLNALGPSASDTDSRSPKDLTSYWLSARAHCVGQNLINPGASLKNGNIRLFRRRRTVLVETDKISANSFSLSNLKLSLGIGNGCIITKSNCLRTINLSAFPLKIASASLQDRPRMLSQQTPPSREILAETQNLLTKDTYRHNTAAPLPHRTAAFKPAMCTFQYALDARSTFRNSGKYCHLFVTSEKSP